MIKSLIRMTLTDVAMLTVACGLLFSGCTKEPSEVVVPGGGTDDPGRSGQLKVQTSVQTRSAVDGTVLPQGSAIGVVVTTTDGSSFFTSSATTGGSADGGYYPDGRNVRFCNETGVNTWTSTTVDGKTRLLLFSGGESGKVYGYYPWTADGDIEGTGSSATVPVGILREGTIDVHGIGGSDKAATAEGEKDYMYSSRNDEVGTATTTTACLVMEHVLARVSFRMYVSAAAQAAVDGDEGSYYEFTGYTLRNRNGSDDLVARFDGNTRMKVSTGDITGALSGGEYVRRIEGYRLERSKSDTPDDNNSIASASASVGHLCFPQSIAHDGAKATGIEAVFEVRRMRGDGSVAQASAGYSLPLVVEPGRSDEWLSGKHYIYTVKFTGNSLSIESVRVTDWNEVVGGDMNIGEDPYVSSSEVDPATGDIPGGGATCRITIKGLLPSSGIDVRALIEGMDPVTGTATVSGKAVELAIPWNGTGKDRSVTFEYYWKGTWHQIGESRSQPQFAPAVGVLYGGGVIYWVNPDNPSDFRVVAMNVENVANWAAYNGWYLGDEAADQNKRNGAEIMTIAKNFSASHAGATGDFAKDFPVFNYCNQKTDGGVNPGTWFLPSVAELKDLWDVRAQIQEVMDEYGINYLYLWDRYYHYVESATCVEEGRHNAIYWPDGNVFMSQHVSYLTDFACVRKAD